MIKKYLVTFDLSVSNEILYAKAEEYLQHFCLFAKPTKNVYLIGDNNIKAENIKNDLKCLFNNNAVILVISIGGDYSSFNYTSINKSLMSFVDKK